VRPLRGIPVFERFLVLICVPIVWIYAVILTASGTYRDKSSHTQHNCRTDRANLISTAPWYISLEHLEETIEMKNYILCHSISIDSSTLLNLDEDVKHNN